MKREVVKTPVKLGRPKLTEGQKRARKGWRTRFAYLRAEGRIDADGNPTPEEQRKRFKEKQRAWETRRAAMA